jgi:hypothetical protein
VNRRNFALSRAFHMPSRFSCAACWKKRALCGFP